MALQPVREHRRVTSSSHRCTISDAFSRGAEEQRRRGALYLRSPPQPGGEVCQTFEPLLLLLFHPHHTTTFHLDLKETRAACECALRPPEGAAMLKVRVYRLHGNASAVVYGRICEEGETSRERRVTHLISWMVVSAFNCAQCSVLLFKGTLVNYIPVKIILHHRCALSVKHNN